jgi:antitoxin component YwqK of YwqJK toxin-antitoxin module
MKKLNGEIVSYYDNSNQIFIKSNFRDDKLHGKTTCYYENGDIEWIRTYENGNFISCEYFKVGETK